MLPANLVSWSVPSLALKCSVLAGAMELPDKLALEGMQRSDVRALCKKHAIKQTDGARSKTKEEMINALLQHFAGPDALLVHGLFLFHLCRHAAECVDFTRSRSESQQADLSFIISPQVRTQETHQLDTLQSRHRQQKASL